MAKKVLIFFPHPLKKNFGGPYTYLYHLKAAFHSVDVELTFLSDLVQFEERSKKPALLSFLKKLIKPFVPGSIIYSRRITRYLKEIKEIPSRDEIKNIDLNTFDIIHFHETIDIWRTVDLFREYKGTIVLTSHTAKPYHLELLEDVFGLKSSQILEKVYHNLRTIDSVAFTNAHWIVAPCTEAMEVYEEQWPLLSAILEKKKQFFIATGVETATITTTEDKITVRRMLSVPNNGFIVCFNGRHQPVKGYDLVVASAGRLLKLFPDLYFLVTGKKDDPSLIKHERWIETGWTEKPEDFIAASDIVIVPNRQTYFDLNVLTSLSLAKPIALSETGGNRYFRQFDLPAILFFEANNEEALINAIQAAYKMRENLDGERNRELFFKQFTLDKFVKAYNQFYLSI